MLYDQHPKVKNVDILRHSTKNIKISRRKKILITHSQMGKLECFHKKMIPPKNK